jgi:hypothetical protein
VGLRLQPQEQLRWLARLQLLLLLVRLAQPVLRLAQQLASPQLEGLRAQLQMGSLLLSQ